MADESKKATTPQAETPPVTPMLPDDPNEHFKQWLEMNHYEVNIEALSSKNPYLAGKGYVLTDKPLLVVAIKKGDN